MSDKAKDTLNNVTDNAAGGRGGLGNVGDSIGALAKTGDGKKKKKKDGEEEEELDEGFGIEHKDVKGSLKIHIKLDLEADIRVIARIKGDIAIGLL